MRLDGCAWVIVTGAQGFVGRNLVACISRRWPDVKVFGLGRSRKLDTFTHRVDLGDQDMMAPLPGELKAVNANPRYEYLSLDLNAAVQMADLLRRVQPTVIFHLATVLRDSDPEALEQSNVQATASLMDAVADMTTARPRIVLGSTGGVYGKPGELPITETQACTPLGDYAVSKQRAEQIARRIADANDIDLITARIFNPVGAGLDERHLPAHLANQLARIMRGQLKPVVGFSPLTTSRDFVDVHDVAEALVLLASKGRPGETYNIASGQETPVQAIWDKLLSVARRRGLASIDVQIGEPRAVDVPRHFAAIEKIRELGFRQTRSLSASMDDMLDWYLETVLPA